MESLRSNFEDTPKCIGDLSIWRYYCLRHGASTAINTRQTFRIHRVEKPLYFESYVPYRRYVIHQLLASTKRIVYLPGFEPKSQCVRGSVEKPVPFMSAAPTKLLIKAPTER